MARAASARRSVLKLAAAGAAVLLLTSCSGGAADGAAPAANAPPAGGGGRGGRAGGGPVPVTTAPVVQRAMPVNVRAVGNVEPSTTVDIRAQVTGALLKVGFSEGQDVTAGQLLFTLDSRPFD